jgi:hypothetical protein
MKVERNAPCPCGSGKKFKKCCGHQTAIAGGPETCGITPAGKSICNFECTKGCSESCCTGATLITIEEIGKCYDTFPITVGFRKYTPMNSGHEAFLNEIGMESGNHFIVGDFVAGNWRRKRCMALDSKNLCRLHREGRKPLQCRIVPFCAIYPEDRQDIVFVEQKGTKFSGCKGFKPAGETDFTVWQDGMFTNGEYRDAFYGYRRGLAKQKHIMQRILDELKEQKGYSDFLKGEGILETFIPVSILFEVLEVGELPIDEYYSFLREQSRLCQHELMMEKNESPVLKDYLMTLNKIAEMYAAFVKNQKSTPQT